MTYSPWGIQPLEAYASAVSVVAGGSISFHVSVVTPAGGKVSLEVYRSSQLQFDSSQFGTQADHIYQTDYRQRIAVAAGQSPVYSATFAPQSHPTPSGYGVAAQNGCGWPSAATWQVPAGLPSGVYLARVTYQTNTTYALFVVRPANPGRTSKILCQLSVHTYQAYNPWPDACYYATPVSQAGEVGTVSFERPCQLWDFILYDAPIVSWLERNFPVEFCTNVDLHVDSTLLQNHQLFISSGHDEYWSSTMRDRIDAFAAAGGNVMFLSGNTCYRIVDYDPGTKKMTRIALSWPPTRPNAWTIGLGFSGGHWASPLPAEGQGPSYLVKQPSHWAFTGTGLQLNQPLGQPYGAIGYETDAAWPDQSPADLVTLADAALPDWGAQDVSPAHVTMGLFRKNDNGVLVNVGSTGWGQGLLLDTGNVHLVTSNLVRRLRRRFGILYAITTAGKMLFYRDKNQDGTGAVANGQVIGYGGWTGFKSVFSGGDGIIYAITTIGKLLFYRDANRDGTGTVTGGTTVGYGGWAGFKSVFSGGDGIIYAITTGGDLIFYRDANRDGTGTVTGGTTIGYGGWADFKSVFSGGDGIIYAITTGGDLIFYRDANRDGTGGVANGQVIGNGGWADFKSVFSDGDGVLYAITMSGDLLFYRDYNRDGTGAVVGSTTIGNGGWDQMWGVFAGS
ncbi:MAG: tachylectin-related carbohydrate-binding protein [Minicystis sp.]